MIADCCANSHFKLNCLQLTWLKSCWCSGETSRLWLLIIIELNSETAKFADRLKCCAIDWLVSLISLKCFITLRRFQLRRKEINESMTHLTPIHNLFNTKHCVSLLQQKLGSIARQIEQSNNVVSQWIDRGTDYLRTYRGNANWMCNVWLTLLWSDQQSNDNETL